MCMLSPSFSLRVSGLETEKLQIDIAFNPIEFPVDEKAAPSMFPFFGKKLLSSRLFVLQNQYFKSISHVPESSNPLSLTIDYLINSCGLSQETALSAAKRIRRGFTTTEKPDAVLNFLAKNGFSKTHITKLVSLKPQLLTANVDRTLRPKIELFQDLGISGSKLAELIASNPRILVRSLSTQIIPTLELVGSFVGTADNVVKAVKRSRWLLSSNPATRMQPNIDILRDHKIPNSRLVYLIINQPGTLMVKPELLKEIIETLKRLGFKPESGMFTIAIHTMTSMSKSTWEAKLKLLKDMGWSEEQIFAAFKRLPIFLACSEKKMREGMEFFAKALDWKASLISKYPKLLLFSLKERVIPRFVVWKILMSKGLVTKEWELIAMLNLTEEVFLERYVTKYQDEVPDLVKPGKVGYEGGKFVWAVMSSNRNCVSGQKELLQDNGSVFIFQR